MKESYKERNIIVPFKPIHKENCTYKHGAPAEIQISISLMLEIN
jgi:hypothetical protein